VKNENQEFLRNGSCLFQYDFFGTHADGMPDVKTKTFILFAAVLIFFMVAVALLLGR